LLEVKDRVSVVHENCPCHQHGRKDNEHELPDEKPTGDAPGVHNTVLK